MVAQPEQETQRRANDPDAALCYVGRQPCGCVGYLSVKPDDTAAGAERRLRFGTHCGGHEQES